jgi:hypothetical protein
MDLWQSWRKEKKFRPPPTSPALLCWMRAHARGPVAVDDLLQISLTAGKFFVWRHRISLKRKKRFFVIKLSVFFELPGSRILSPKFDLAADWQRNSRA